MNVVTGYESLPRSLECERALLGAILLENTCMDQALELIKHSDFHLDSHGRLFQMMTDLHAQGFPIDMPTLLDKAGGLRQLERVGGASYIASLIDGVPRTDTIEPYANAIRQKATVRAVTRAASQIVTMCLDDSEDPDLLDRAQRIFWDACDSGTPAAFAAICEVAREYLAKVESIGARGIGVTGLSTGLLDFDYKTLGLQRKDLVILAGRPSTGKTTLSFNIADHIARAGHSVAYFSMEMASERLGEKAISSHARVDSVKMRAGALGRDEWIRASESAAQMEGLNLYVCDQARLSTVELKARARRLKRERGLDLVVVDYLQLLRGDRRFNQSRFEMVGENVQDLKAMAKELDLCVVALSQLSRAVEGRHPGSSRPQLSDLGESGEIERVADIVAFIYRPPEAPLHSQIARIFLGKNRNGPTGEFDLTYMRALNRFTGTY